MKPFNMNPAGPALHIGRALPVALVILIQIGGGSGRASGFEFEAVLNNDQYRQAVAAMPAERIDPVQVAASKFPAFSTWIDSVVPGSPAEEAGLRRDWRIVGFNGREIWTHHQRLIDGEDHRRLKVVSPDGEENVLTFEPDGRLGTTSSNNSRPERAVLEAIPRGGWDHDMMVAAVAWDAGDWNLAETALRRARDAGLEAHPVTSLYGALIALERRDLVASRGLMRMVVKKFPPEGPVPKLYQRGLRTLALAHGDYMLAMRLAADHQGLVGLVQPERLREWSL